MGRETLNALTELTISGRLNSRPVMTEKQERLVMTKRDDYSPEVSSQVENQIEIKAAEAFTRRAEDRASLDEVSQKVILEACKAAYHSFSKKGLLPLEDLGQEVISKILDAKRPYQGDEKLRPFAYRIAKNHLLNLCKKSKRCMNAAEIQAKHNQCRESEERSEAEILDLINLDRLEINRNYEEDQKLCMIAAEEFLTLLTPHQRVVLQQLDAGFEQTEIAKSFGVSPQAISNCRVLINKKLWIYLNDPKQKSFAKSPKHRGGSPHDPALGI